MQKRSAPILTIAFSALLLTAACSSSTEEPSSDAAETITLTYATYHPNTHIGAREGVDAFVELVEDKSDGRISIEVHYSSALGGIGESIQLLESGVADLAFFPVFYMDELPASSISALPLGATAWEWTNTFWTAVHQEGPLKDEWEAANIIPLMTPHFPAPEFNATEQELHDMSDLSGLRIRAGSDVHAAVIEAVGGNPVNISGNEIFEAFDRGTVDAGMLAFSAWGGYGLESVVRHATLGVEAGGPTTTATAISASTWDSLNEVDKAILQEAGIEAMASFQDAVIEDEESAREALVAEHDVSIYEWSEDDLVKYRAVVDPVAEQWVTEMESAGVSGEEAMTLVRDLLAEHEGATSLVAGP